MQNKIIIEKYVCAYCGKVHIKDREYIVSDKLTTAENKGPKPCICIECLNELFKDEEEEA